MSLKWLLPLLAVLVVLIGFLISQEDPKPHRIENSVSRQEARNSASEPSTQIEMGSIIGRVFEGETGEAVEEATVHLIGVRSSVMVVHSDQQGAFRFTDVPRGTWKLMAQAPNLVSFDHAADIPTLTIDHEVKHHGPINLELQKARSLLLQVFSRSEMRVLEDAVIHVTELKRDFRTDNAGLATLDLAPGRWTLRIKAPKHRTATISIELADGETSSQSVMLEPAGEGRFSVVDTADQPIPGVTFTASAGLATLQTGNSDNAGAVVLDQLPLDPAFRLTLSHNKYQTVRETLDFPKGEDQLERRFVMELLPPEQRLADGQYLISGRVLDHDGHPLQDVSVSRLKGRMTVKTSRNGQFKLGPFIPEGRHASILFLIDGHAAEIRDVDLGGAERWIKLGDVRLEPDRIFSGRVVDREGYPVPEATLTLETVRKFSHSDFMDTTVNHDGAFRLTSLPRGSKLRFQAPGFFPKSLLFHEIPLDNEDTVVVMDAYPDLSGRVVDVENGNPVEKFWFRVASDARETLIHSSDGSFVHPLKKNLLEQRISMFQRPEAYLPVTIRAEGYVANRFLVSLEELRGDEPVLFELSRGKELAVSVMYEDHGPVPDARVVILTVEEERKQGLSFEDVNKMAGGENPWETGQMEITDSRGRAMFDAVPAGYRLFATAFGPGLGLTTVTINPDDPGALIFVQPASRITGLVDRQSFPEPGRIRITWQQSVKQGIPRKPEQSPVGPGALIPTSSVTRNLFLDLEPDNDQFQLDGLSGGPVEATLFRDHPTNGRQAVDWKKVELEPGAHEEVRLGFDMASLTGTAYIDGQPAPAAHLYLFSEKDNLWRATRTDDQGEFSFTKLASGLWTLALRGSDQPSSGGFFLPAHVGNAFEIELQSHVEQDFHFDKYANVRGRVVDAPPEASLVVTWKGNGHVSAPINLEPDGSFFIQSLAPGVLRLALLRGSGRPVVLAEKVNITEDGRDLDLGELEIPETGSLQVFFDFPEWAAGREIKCEAHHLETGRRLFIDQVRPKDGTLTYNELATGRISLTFSATNSIIDPAYAELEIVANQTSEHRIRVQDETGLIFSLPDHTITTAFLRDQNGQDLTIEEVEGWSLPFVKSGYSGEKGHIFGLNPGLYELFLIDESGDAHHQTVEVQPNRHNRVVIMNQLAHKQL